MTVPLMFSIPVLCVLSVRFARRDPLSRLVVLYTIAAILMGPTVWNWWASFTRPMLPLMAFALIALGGDATRKRQAGLFAEL